MQRPTATQKIQHQDSGRPRYSLSPQHTFKENPYSVLLLSHKQHSHLALPSLPLLAPALSVFLQPIHYSLALLLVQGA